MTTLLKSSVNRNTFTKSISLLFILVFFQDGWAQNSFRWNGSVSSNWNVAANWTPTPASITGFPGANDFVDIGKTTRSPTLVANTTVTALRVDNEISAGSCSSVQNVILNMNGFSLTVGQVKSPTSATGVFTLENCDAGSTYHPIWNPGGYLSTAQANFLLSCSGAGCATSQFIVNGTVTGAKSDDKFSSNVDVAFNFYGYTDEIGFRIVKFDKNFTIAGMASADPCFVFKGFRPNYNGDYSFPDASNYILNTNINTIVGNLVLVNRTNKIFRLGWHGYDIGGNLYFSNTGGGVLRTANVTGQILIKLKNGVLGIVPTETNPQSGIVQILDIKQTNTNSIINIDMTTCPGGVCSSTPSSSTVLNLSGNTFAGTTFFKTPSFNISPLRDPNATYVITNGYENNIFLNSFSLIKTGPQNDYLSGGNIFKSDVNITNTGTGSIDFSKPTSQSTVCGIGICGACQANVIGDFTEYDANMPGDIFSGNITLEQSCTAGPINLVASNVSSTTISGHLTMRIHQNLTVSGGLTFIGNSASGQNFTVNDVCNTNPILNVGTVQSALTAGNLILNYISSVSNHQKLFVFDKSTVFTSGKIDANGNTIQLNGSGTAHTGKNTSYIIVSTVGGVRRNVSNTTTPLTYPVGTSSTYYPIIAQNATTNNAPVLVQMRSGIFVDYTNFTSSGTNISNQFISAVWLINSTVAGLRAELKGGWNNAATLTGFAPATSSRMSRNNGTSWDCVGTNGAATVANPAFVPNFSSQTLSSLPGIYSVLSDDLDAGMNKTVCGVTFSTSTMTATAFVGGTWSVISKPALATVTFSSTTSGSAIVSGLTEDGAYTLRWTSTGYCGASDFKDVIITKRGSKNIPNLSYSGSSPYCTTGGTITPSITPSSLSGGAFSSSGGLSINGSTGNITLGTSSTGPFTINYTVSVLGCGMSSTTVGITINSIPGVNIAYNSPVCNTQTTHTASTVLNTVSGGTYTAEAGLSIALNGTINPSTSSAGTFKAFYTYSIAGCGTQIYTTSGITVTSLPSTPILNYGTSRFCSSNVPISLSSSSNTVGGSFLTSATGLLTLNPTTGQITAISQSTLAGVFVIRYDIPASAGCAAVSGNNVVTLAGVPNPLTITGPVGTQCYGNTPTLTANGSVSGTTIQWKQGGANVGTGLTTYTTLALTNTGYNYVAIVNNNVCAPVTSAGFTINVHPNPTVTGFNVNKTFACTSQDVTLANASTVGNFSYAVNTGAGFNFISGNTYTFTNTIVGNAFSFVGIALFPNCQTLTSPIIIVNSSLCGLTADFTTNPNPVCLTSGVVTITDNSFSNGGAITGYQWDFGGGTGGNVNTAGPHVITYSSASSKTIRLTVTGTGNVTNITTQQVDVNSLTGSTISYGTPSCNQATSLTPNIFNPVNGGVFSVSGVGLSLNTTTGVVNPSLSTQGTYTIRYNYTIPGCGAISTTTSLRINSLPGILFEYAASPFCKNGSNPTASTTIGGSGGIFSSNPLGLVFVNTSTGAVNLTTSNAGTYNVTYTISVPGCGNITSTLGSALTINSIPGVNIVYNSPVCNTQTTHNASTVLNTVSGGTYTAENGLSIDANGTINTSTSSAGTFKAFYTYSIAGCGTQIYTTTGITVTSLPSTPVLSYNTSPYCSSQTLIPLFSSTGTAFGTYETTASGIFTLNNTTGALSIPQNNIEGLFEIRYDIPAIAGCASVSGSTLITLTGVPNPLSITGVSGNQCYESSHILTANGTVAGTTIQWRENGFNVGSNSNTYNSSALTTVGTNTFFAIINNGVCAPVTSTGFDITINLNPTITGITSNKSFACKSQSVQLTEMGVNSTFVFAVNTGAGFNVFVGNSYEFTNTIIGNAFSFVGYSFIDGCQTVTSSPILIVNSSVCGLTADFDRSILQQCLNDATSTGVTFTNRSTTAGGTILGYTWDFGDGASPQTTTVGINSTNYDINVKYLTSGPKTIGLTILGTGNVINSTSNSVQIDALSENGTMASSVSLPLCYNNATNLELSNSVGNLNWYSTISGVALGTSTILGTGSLLANNTYFATAKNGVCPMVTTSGFEVNVRTQATVSGFNLPTEFQCLGLDAKITATGINGIITGWQTSDDNINWSSTSYVGSVVTILENLDESQYYRPIVTNGAGCLPVTVSSSVLVTATGCTAIVSFTGLPAHSCSDFASVTGFELSPAVTSLAPILAYTWSFPGLGASIPSFNGINPPILTYAVSGPKTVRLTVTIAGGKVFSNDITMPGANVNIDLKPITTFTYPNGANYCQNYGFVSPENVIKIGTTTGIFYSNNSGLIVDNNGIINTSNSTPNTIGVVYYALNPTNGCPATTSNGVSFTIRDNPTVFAPRYDNADIYCSIGNTQVSSPITNSAAGYYALFDGNSQISTTTGGAFDINNITNTFKEYQVKYVISETATCREVPSTPKVISVNGAAFGGYSINYNVGDDQCASSNVPTSGPSTPSPSTSFGRFSSNISGAVDATDGNITYSAFVVGTTKLNVLYSYTYPGINCPVENSNTTITITKLSKPLSDLIPLTYNISPVAKGNNGVSLCNNTLTSVFVMSNFTYTGGLFSINNGGNIDPITGAINLSNMLPKTYTITHSATAAGKCDTPPSSFATITVTTANFSDIEVNEPNIISICAYYNEGNRNFGNVFRLTNYTEGFCNWSYSTDNGASFVEYPEKESFITNRTFEKGEDVILKANISNGACNTMSKEFKLKVFDEPIGGKTIAINPFDTLMCYNPMSTPLTLEGYRGTSFTWDYVYFKANMVEKDNGLTVEYNYDSPVSTIPTNQDGIIHTSKPFESNADFKSFLIYKAQVTNGDCKLDKNRLPVYSSILRLRKCAKYPFIPNALEPNGSSLENSFWNIQMLRLPDNTDIRILNRYGAEVFYMTGKDLQTKPFNGDGLPAGTYYYVIDVKNGKPFTGDLTIVR